jgi:cation diffusion facilitator family transporter
VDSPSSKKVIFAALIGNSLIAVTKFIAAGIGGSSAMLSEGIHSLVDTGNQVLLLYGLRQSRKPPSPAFPFGHGKEIYFWAFVVAILIFALGAGISIHKGIQHILEPTPILHIRINIVVLALAMVFEGFALGIALRAFNRVKGRRGFIEAVRRGKDPSLFVVLFEDSAAMLGLVAALLGISLTYWTGDGTYDGIASVFIGLILGGTAAWLAYETKGLLIGESASEEVVRGIREMIQASPIIEGVNEILTMHMGPEFVLVNISVNFKDTTVPDEMEATIAGLDSEIKRRFPTVKRIFVEAESRRVGGPSGGEGS